MNKDIFIQRKKRFRVVPLLLAAALLAAIVAAGIYGTTAYQNWNRDSHTADAASLLGDARASIEAGDTTAAAAILEPIAEKGQNAEALILLAKIRQEEGNGEEAEALLRTVVDKFPNDPQRQASLVQLGRVVEQLGRDEDARAIYTGVRETAPPDLRAPALTGLARLAYKNGQAEDALAMVRQAVKDAPWDSPQWNEALDLLGTINVEVIFSTAQTKESAYYTVETGDNLTDIGKKLNTTQGLLTRANGITDEATLRVGDRLKYTHKDFRIVIERDTRRLFLFDGSGLFKRYNVGLGREGHETALGAYRIGNKQKEPDWFKPGEGRIPFGDPRNELGTRWMPLVPEAEELPRDLGIHGTWADDSVGEFSSSGCARMANAEVEELFDLVVRATPVEIVERIEPVPAA